MTNLLTSNLASKLMTFWRKPISATALTLYTLFYIALVDNLYLWQQVFERNRDHIGQGLYLNICLFGILMTLTYLLVIPFSHRKTIKPILTLLLLCSGAIYYFNSLGVVFDKNMLQNILLSDYREGKELLSFPYIKHMTLFFLLPSIFVLTRKLKPETPWTFIKFRSLAFITIVALGIGVPFLNYKAFSFFARENNDLKVFANPVFAILEARGLVNDRMEAEKPFTVLGTDAQQVKTDKQRVVGIFVVGETARADHFGINHYARNTTPKLSKKHLVTFENAESCGTSTAYSVPCMFSFLGQNHYSPGVAAHQSNLLDVLETAGIKTLWRDNNSTCKGVCARIETENFRDDPDQNSEYFHIDQYFDEILLTQLKNKIESTQSDILIVLHPLGSHGPAYHRRFPERFAKFTPYCSSDTPQACTEQEVINAYDNTILYTDFILGSIIDLLENSREDYASFMMYVSDHGESLGENGVYLHGMPKFIAPIEQVHVPLVFWSSQASEKALSIDEKQLENCQHSAISHDNISHSLLSLYKVQTSLYRRDLDLFSGACQKQSVAYEN